MSKLVSVSEKTLGVLLLNNFRYCLGRTTYEVYSCVECLISYWKALPECFRVQIQEDIKKATERGNAGMEGDIKEWNKLLSLPISINPSKEVGRLVKFNK